MSFSAQIKSTSPNQKKPADSENPTKLSLSQKKVCVFMNGVLCTSTNRSLSVLAGYVLWMGCTVSVRRGGVLSSCALLLCRRSKHHAPAQHPVIIWYAINEYLR